MKIGDRIYVRGYVDEIRKDTVIVRNDGGYFGTTWNEVTPSAQPERWISCSERMPRQGQEVICQCRANMIKVLKLDACGDWYQDAEHCYMSGFVIAWMPLPEPYKEEQE